VTSNAAVVSYLPRSTLSKKMLLLTKLLCGASGRCCLPQFIWANYLRTRVPMVLMAVPDVETYIPSAMSHALQPDAASLPGFTPLEKADEQRLGLMSNLGKDDGFVAQEKAAAPAQ
jgi:hypothetical protein